MADLKPGNLTAVASDYSRFSNSLAQAIEEELDDLLERDGLPPVPKGVNDDDVRARRRFIIAIARGVVRHLHENPDAFVVTQSGGTHTVAINADQL